MPCNIVVNLGVVASTPFGGFLDLYSGLSHFTDPIFVGVSFSLLIFVDPV